MGLFFRATHDTRNRLCPRFQIKAYDRRGRCACVVLHDLETLRFAEVRRIVRDELRAQLNRP